MKKLLFTANQKLTEMKTMKALFVVFLMGCFSLASSAQPPKTVTCVPYPIQDYWLPCMEELVNGELELCTTVWNNDKIQTKFKGFLEGESTGNIYTISQVGNMMSKPFKDGTADVYTWATTITYCLDGMPVFTAHVMGHYTYNANGELVAEVDNDFFECY